MSEWVKHKPVRLVGKSRRAMPRCHRYVIVLFIAAETCQGRTVRRLVSARVVHHQQRGRLYRVRHQRLRNGTYLLVGVVSCHDKLQEQGAGHDIVVAAAFSQRPVRGRLSLPLQGESDLESIGLRLSASNLTHRVFTTSATVGINHAEAYDMASPSVPMQFAPHSPDFRVAAFPVTLPQFQAMFNTITDAVR